MEHATYQQAARLLQQAEALLVTAGAGMGVDSGLPDFRGPQGFWQAYPMYEQLGLHFEEAANPLHFKQDPEFGWGFYGHRLDMYRKVPPHDGFRIILDWVRSMELDLFVVTSNVDGHFQRAGFSDDRIWEVHGSIHHLQCVNPCSGDIFPNQASPHVDVETMRASAIPHCPHCNSVARPNILMFGDWDWIGYRSDAQQARFQQFVQRNSDRQVLVLELGAGTALPTIRHLSERVARQLAGHCIRINPREPEITAPDLSIAAGALESLRKLAEIAEN